MIHQPFTHKQHIIAEQGEATQSRIFVIHIYKCMDRENLYDTFCILCGAL